MHSFFKENGIINSTAPTRITALKPSAMILLDFAFLNYQIFVSSLPLFPGTYFLPNYFYHLLYLTLFSFRIIPFYFLFQIIFIIYFIIFCLLFFWFFFYFLSWDFPYNRIIYHMIFNIFYINF